MKIDKKQLKNAGSGLAVHTVKVDLRKLEALGLYERPVYEPCPVKIDNKAKKKLNALPAPVTSGGVKVDLARMEALGLYTRLPDEPDKIPWYRRIRLFSWLRELPGRVIRFVKQKFRIPERTWTKRQIYMAAGLAASAAMGICLIFCVDVKPAQDGSFDKAKVEYVQPVDENTVAITYIDDVDLSKLADLDLSSMGQFADNVTETQAFPELAELPELPDLPEMPESVVLTEQTDGTYQEETSEAESDTVSEESEESETGEESETEQQEEGSETESETEQQEESKTETKQPEKTETKQPAEEEKILVAVANVEDKLNVRVEASEDSEKAGLMYKDCVGTILEQKDGWTKIESGELVGWVSDEYMIFGDEAQAFVDEAENSAATVEAASLHVRMEPNADSTVVGYVNEGDELTILKVDDNNWAEIEYKDGTAYVNAKHVDIGTMIRTGETMEEIEQREKEEAEAKKAAKEKKVEQEKAKEAELKVEEVVIAVAAEVPVVETAAVEPEILSAGMALNQTDINMIAAMIYCEAGNQSYEGQVAVGAVIMNRIASSKFPNTVEAVLRAPKQFQPVKNGKFDRVYKTGSWSDSCYQAALEAIAGEKGQVAGCLYFKNPKIAGSHKGITIGDHVFW